MAAQSSNSSKFGQLMNAEVGARSGVWVKKIGLSKQKKYYTLVPLWLQKYSREM